MQGYDEMADSVDNEVNLYQHSQPSPPPSPSLPPLPAIAYTLKAWLKLDYHIAGNFRGRILS